MPEIDMADGDQIIPAEFIERRIYMIRGQKVMFDSDLAELFEVTTGRLNEQVKRNASRFPDDFAFQLTKGEYESLISQSATSKKGRGGRRKMPWVFAEHGVAMLSGVLHSEKAIQINVAIIRTFVRMREMLATHKDLADKINEHDGQLAYLFEQVEKLMFQPVTPRHPIGFVPDEDKD